MSRRLAVFDWNGTIVADVQAGLEASNANIRLFGKPDITMTEYRAAQNFPIMHFYAAVGIPADDVLARMDDLQKTFYEVYSARSANCRTRRGVRQLLEWLRTQNVDCIVLSNHMTDFIENEIKRLNLDPYFQVVLANHDSIDIVHRTQKRERLSEFMIKRGYCPDDCFIIGDSIEEPEVARHLGLYSIAVSGGFFSTPRLRAANPDALISHPGAAIDVLAQYWGN